MKSHSFLLLAGLLGALASGQPLVAATESQAAPLDVVQGPESRLQPDMPAQKVLEIMGKPDSVALLRTDSGKAEVWTYHRPLGTVAERAADEEPAAPAVGDALYRDDSRAQAILTDLRGTRQVTTQVTQILMFNDHYAAQKVSREVALKSVE